MKQIWLTVRNNPVFVAIYSTFAGCLGVQIQSAYTSGHIDLTIPGVEHMLVAAALATAWSLAHLYLPQPGATPNAMK